MSDWSWAERGSAVELHDSTPGVTWVKVTTELGPGDEPISVSAELTAEAGRSLVTELVELFGHEFADELEAQREQNNALDLELKDERKVARGLRRDVERLKTAGQHGDDLVRELERKAEQLEVRCEQLALQLEDERARRVLVERRASEGLS